MQGGMAERAPVADTRALRMSGTPDSQRPRSSPGHALRVERVCSPGAVASLEPEWRALSKAHGDGTPFGTFDWWAAWWKSLSASSILVSDSPWLLAFRNGSGSLVGLAPLMLTRRPGRGPAATRVLDFIGADPNLTEIRGPLVDPAWEAAFYESLAGYASAAAGAWDWMAWRGIRPGGPGERHLSSLPGVTFGERLCAYTVALPASWEEFKAGRSRNLKEALRKCRNSLARDGLVARLEVATEPADVGRALERFLELHRMRAEAPDGPRHPDVFASVPARRFLADVVGRFAARGEARVFLLHVGGEVVAARVAFVLGDTLYLYYSGYDPRWRRYSVMTTTVEGAIRHAIAGGLRRLHLSTGCDASKTRWGPEETSLSQGVQIGRTPRALIAATAFQDLHPGRRGGRLARIARRTLGRPAGA